MGRLGIVSEVALGSAGIDHVSNACESAAVDPDAAEDGDFLGAVVREGEVGQRPQRDYAELVGVLGDLVGDELRRVLGLDEGFVVFWDGDAVELLRVVVDAVADWIVPAQEDALLRAQVNRYLRACDLLRNQRVMRRLLQIPPSINASDAQHDLLKPLRQRQRHNNADNVLLAAMRVDDDVLIQLGNGYLSEFSDVHQWVCIYSMIMRFECGGEQDIRRGISVGSCL